jgi:prophage regulatory protein
MQQPERLLRIGNIVGDPKRGLEPMIDFSRSKWWAMVAAGSAPAGILVSPRCRMWTLSSIQKFISDLAAGEVTR